MSEHKKTTVVFPLQGEQLLLGMKKRGFGAGWWNGFGGKLEFGESYVTSAVRETSEEVGLAVDESHLRHAANIIFRFDGKVDVVTKVYIATEFEGTPTETEEMKPQWFQQAEIPYDTMWPGDDKWIPKILSDTALLPLGFIIDFTGDNQFVSIQAVDPKIIASYF